MRLFFENFYMGGYAVKMQGDERRAMWMPLGMGVGTALGIVFGAVTGNMLTGIGIGAVAGFLLGALVYAAG